MPVDILAHPTLVPLPIRIFPWTSYGPRSSRSGWSRPCSTRGDRVRDSDRYRPHERLVQRAHDRGVRLSLGSDGHTRTQVGDLAFPSSWPSASVPPRCAVRSVRARDARLSVIRYHARWVLPISSPPIRDGTVVEHEGRIVYVGPRDEAPDGTDRDLGDCALLPGPRQRAHASRAHRLCAGCSKISLSARGSAAAGREGAVISPERFLDSARCGHCGRGCAPASRRTRTRTTPASSRSDARAGVRGIMYQEVFAPADPCRRPSRLPRAWPKSSRCSTCSRPSCVQVGVSPHAPYSVSDALFASADFARSGRRHRGSHRRERRRAALRVRRRGPIRGAHRAAAITVTRGRDVANRAAREARRARCAAAAHPLRARERRRHRADCRQQSTVAHCPISNAKLGHGVAPVLEMLDAGNRGGAGLGLDGEQQPHGPARGVARCRARAAIRGERDALPAPRALELATLGGARALGLERRVGSLEVGKDGGPRGISRLRHARTPIRRRRRPRSRAGRRRGVVRRRRRSEGLAMDLDADAAESHRRGRCAGARCGARTSWRVAQRDSPPRPFICALHTLRRILPETLHSPQDATDRWLATTTKSGATAVRELGGRDHPRR